MKIVFNMIRQRMWCLFNNNISTVVPQYRSLSATNVLLLNQKWRKERGLPMNPNARGVLTDSPDYTFLDGRITPYGIHQRDRIMKQREVVKDIINLTSEIDFAVERHKQLQINEENRMKEILSNKLKPKGLALLKSK